MEHWSTWSGQFVQVTQIQSVLVCHGGGTATLLVTLAVVFWSQPATAHSTICHFKGCVRRAKREHRNGCNSKTCKCISLGRCNGQAKLNHNQLLDVTRNKDAKWNLPKAAVLQKCRLYLRHVSQHFFGVPLKRYLLDATFGKWNCAKVL